jgi:trigger factor
MDVKIETLSSVKKQLSFEVGADQVNAEIEKAYQKIGRTAKIKGFRPGKIPRHLLEQYYGPQMEEQVLSKLINDSYFKALANNDIRAIADPQIVESGTLEKGKPFSYTAQVEVKPEIEVRDYQGLPLIREELLVNDKVIDDRLVEMQASRAEMQVSERTQAAKGDFVTIDFEGSVNGELFPGGQAKDHVLELGSGSFIPGFEEQVVGMARGEERSLNVTFPEEYGNKELAGKAAVFRVLLKEIKEKVQPLLDDEFAKGFGLESLSELREKLTSSYQVQESERIKGDLRDRLVQALIERNPIEVPEVMVDKQLEYMLDNLRKRFQSQGMTLEMLGLSDDVFRSKYRETAVRQVQGSLLLEGISRQEKVAVEEGEIDDKLVEIAQMANAPVDAVKNYYARDEARRSLVSQIIEEKTIQLLLDQARITEVSKDQLPDNDAHTKE